MLNTSTLGLYFGYSKMKTILLVSDRLTIENYQIVVMHELGHSLGLDHSSKHGNLMFPTIDYSNTGITKGDLIEFCKIHMCEVQRLQN